MNYEAIIDKALFEPVTITRDGRDRLVLLSFEEYQRLKRATASSRGTSGCGSTIWHRTATEQARATQWVIARENGAL